jgi:hypothetical protein
VNPLINPLRRMCTRTASLALLLAASGVLGGTATASASGSCGNNDAESAACGVNSPQVFNGILEAPNEQNFYVFHATQHSIVKISLTNNSPSVEPDCLPDDLDVKPSCGYLEAFLDFDVPNAVRDEEVGDGTDSTPTEGNARAGVPAVARAGVFAAAIPTNGTYYLVIGGAGGTGNLATEANGNPNDPYSLTVTVTAGDPVYWPTCTVPKLARNTALAAEEQILEAKGCTVGKVTHSRNSHIKRGLVASISPRGGTALPHSSKVNVNVSLGRHPGS